MTDENKPKLPREEDGDAAIRARNRTVMLTPDITGQVRARLQQELNTPEGEFITPMSTGARPPQPLLPQQPQRIVQPQQLQQPQHAQVVQPKSPLVGFLVSFDNDTTGEYFELRTGRVIITSDKTSASNHLVIDHETVSPMHAILRIAPTGDIQVLDQLSEHGTAILRVGGNEEETLCGDKSALENGDVVRFGKRSFIVCVIQRNEEG